MKTASQIIEILKNATGQFTKVKFQSVVKTSAKFKTLEILKVSNTVVRSGIDFSNLKSVKEAIATGERGEVKPLKWGSWKSFPYIIEHTNAKNEYKEYVRLYPSLAPNHIPNVKYFVDGIETAKNDILQYLTPSTVEDLKNPKRPECFNVTNTNILDLEEIAN